MRVYANADTEHKRKAIEKATAKGKKSLADISPKRFTITDEETQKCVIIDPGADSNTILDYVESNKLKPVAIFLINSKLGL